MDVLANSSGQSDGMEPLASFILLFFLHGKYCLRYVHCVWKVLVGLDSELNNALPPPPPPQKKQNRTKQIYRNSLVTLQTKYFGRLSDSYTGDVIVAIRTKRQRKDAWIEALRHGKKKCFLFLELVP